MKELECEHFVDSIVYLLEQTAVYFNTKGAQFFDQLNIGVTLDQFIAIDTLSFNQGICQQDLAKLILKDRSYTSRIVNTLEKADYIERKIEMKGKRLVKTLYLTKKGEDIIKNNQERLKNSFAKVFEDISEDEFATLRCLLEKMKDNVSKFTVIHL